MVRQDERGHRTWRFLSTETSHPEKYLRVDRCTRSKKTNILGPLKIASPSVALQLWRCWVHFSSRCTSAKRALHSGDQCFCPWPVTTRATSMACWMIIRERCPQLGCSWRSCSSSRPQVAAWCHPMWRETSTNGRMISLTPLSKGLILRWNFGLHHYSRSSRSSLGYYNILMHKVIFLDRSQSSLPLLLLSWRRGGRVSTGFGWSYSSRTLSWERSLSLILTLPTCGLRTGDLVGLCQLLALLVRLDIWSTWQGPYGIRPRTFLVSFWHLPTGQSCTNWHPNTEGKSTAASVAWVLPDASSVGLFSWLADIKLQTSNRPWSFTLYDPVGSMLSGLYICTSNKWLWLYLFWNTYIYIYIILIIYIDC